MTIALLGAWTYADTLMTWFGSGMCTGPGLKGYILCERGFIATSSMYALSCIRGNKVFELELELYSTGYLYIWPMAIAQRTAHLLNLTPLSLAGSRVFLLQNNHRSSWKRMKHKLTAYDTIHKKLWPYTKTILTDWSPTKHYSALYVSRLCHRYFSTVPNRYLYQWWVIVDWTFESKLQWNLNQIQTLFQEKAASMC